MVQPTSDPDAKGPYEGRKEVAPQFQENYSQEINAYASPSLTLPLKSCLNHPLSEKLICEPSSCFPILWPLNKDCALSTSVLTLLLVIWTQMGKWTFPAKAQGLSWARAQEGFHMTNSVTTPCNYPFFQHEDEHLQKNFLANVFCIVISLKKLPSLWNFTSVEIIMSPEEKGKK